MPDPILSVRDLSVVFDVNPQNAWSWTPPLRLHAVSGLSLDLQQGETLVPVTSGDILYRG